jgi:hypothetical protein
MTTVERFLEGLTMRLGRAPGPSDLSDADVSAAERVIGHRFPPSYHRLVTSCVWEEMPHWIYWLGRNLPPGVDLLRIRQIAPVPPFLVPICGDGAGDEFCFDTREPDSEGEYPIVRWEHETHDEHSTSFERVTPDLGTFLLQLL